METPFSLRVTLHPHGKAWAEEDGSTWALSEVAECSEPDWEPVSSLGPHRMIQKCLLPGLNKLRTGRQRPDVQRIGYQRAGLQ